MVIHLVYIWYIPDYPNFPTEVSPGLVMTLILSLPRVITLILSLPPIRHRTFLLVVMWVCRARLELKIETVESLYSVKSLK